MSTFSSMSTVSDFFFYIKIRELIPDNFVKM